MAASLVAVRGMVRSLAHSSSGPGEVLTRLNTLLLDDFPCGRFVTMVYAELDPGGRKLRLANAGHLPPLLIEPAGHRWITTESGLPLGIAPSKFSETEIVLADNSQITLYSDGITEAALESGEEYGAERLLAHVWGSGVIAINLIFLVEWLLGLPVLTLALYLQGLPLLLMRSNMLEVMHEEFVTMARMKGFSEWRIVINHAARNALLPVVTAFALGVGLSMGGNVVIETVFSWPGIGRLLVQAVSVHDYPLAQGAFLMIALVLALMNFVADLLYMVLDPRVSHGQKS